MGTSAASLGWRKESRPGHDNLVWKTSTHPLAAFGRDIYRNHHFVSPKLGISWKSVGQADHSVRDIFEKMAAQWKAETRFKSSIHEKVLHRSYQRIIGLGREAIPYIIRDLKESKSDWFWALNAITGENPVPSDLEGNVIAMVECWVSWARVNELE